MPDNRYSTRSVDRIVKVVKNVYVIVTQYIVLSLNIKNSMNFLKRMQIGSLMTILLFLILSSISQVCTANPVTDTLRSSSDDSLVNKIDAIMLPYSGKDKPGAVIGIIDNGKIIFQKGYGMAEFVSKKLNHPDQIYKIASVSKQFTAAGTIELVRQGKLALDDNVRKYLPELPDYGKTITIADLLYHTSGIRDYMVLMWLTGKSFEENFSNDDALQIIYRQSKLHFSTGTRCVYSNSNYILLAEVIKTITGTSLNDYISLQLFQPLNMFASGYGLPKGGLRNKLASSYFKTATGYKSYKNNNLAVGDGGMYTTLGDLLNWDKTFYDTKSLATEILTKGKLFGGGMLNYGMGIMHGFYKGQPIQMHPGAFLGYRAEILRFPQKRITIICLGNSEEINPEIITKAIAGIYVFKEQAKNLQETISMNDQQLKLIIGKYEVAPNVFVDISHDNNQLTGQLTGQPKQTLIKTGQHTYAIGNSGDTAIFRSEFYGKMQELVVVQKTGLTVAKRPDIVAITELGKYLGKYECEEQKVTYNFYLKDNKLWFKPGNGPAIQGDILKEYNRIHFGYQNLEQATIDFNIDESKKVIGFTLNSGRVSSLKFLRSDAILK